MFDLPVHLYVLLNEDGDGPVGPDEAIMEHCWCPDGARCAVLPRVTRAWSTVFAAKQRADTSNTGTSCPPRGPKRGTVKVTRTGWHSPTAASVT